MARIKRVLWVFSLGVTGDTLDRDTQMNVERAVRELMRSAVPFDRILVSGGVFKPGQTEAVADLMAQAFFQAPKLGIPMPQILIANQSDTTRGDVRDGVKRLVEAGLTTKGIMLTVVSEQWHLRGIKVLLKRFRWFGSITYVRSGYKISWKQRLGRIARIPLYWVDPEGNGAAATRVHNRRARA